MKALRRTLAAVASVALVTAAGGALAAGNAEPSMDAMAKDLMQQSQGNGDFRFAFWLPTEFFVRVAPKADAATIDSLRKSLRGYAIFFVLDAHASALGMPVGRPRAEVLAGTFLQLEDGTRLSPLGAEQLHGDIKTLVDIMKPMMKNMLGALGEAMEAVVFEDAGADGASRLDPLAKGQFKVVVGSEAFSWRLPLGSMMAPMFDPETHERFPGNYRFNPFTGAKLQPQ